MRVTCLIANHNYGRYVEECLQACLNQTYPCNICFVDDASTDNSLDIAQSILNVPLQPIDDYFIGQNQHTIISLKKNMGPSWARNLGIVHTLDSTDIYMVCDADDTPTFNKIETCLPYFEDPNIGIVYADYSIYNVENDTLIREFKQPYSYSKLQQECIIHSQFLVRKDALLKTAEPSGYYDSSLLCCEDWDLELRIAEKYIIVHVPQDLTFVRNHKNNSVGYRSNEIWQKSWQRVSQKAKLRHEKRN